MDFEVFDTLNGIYAPLCAAANETAALLRDSGYTASVKFYNNHSVKRNGGFDVEKYPIPLVEVSEMCDVGFDIDGAFIERAMPREEALRYDFSKLCEYAFEVYGADAYLLDFYAEGLDIAGIADRIRASGEKSVCASVYIPAGASAREVFDAAMYLCDKKEK